MDEMQQQQSGAGVLSGAAKEPDPRLIEGFQLVVGRVREALAKVGPALDTSMKADPVMAAVKFGTEAVRSVVNAAEKAGKPLPFEIVMAAGVQTVKDLAGIANEKGYLDDGGIDVFLKEVMQQSMNQYLEMDAAEGKVSPEQVREVQAKLGEQAGAGTGA